MAFDVKKSFGPEGWSGIEGAIERGEFPSYAEIVKKLRGEQPVPRLVRDYLADRLEGKIKLPPGPRPERFTPRSIYLSLRVRRWQRAYKWMKECGWRAAPKGTPYETALEKVSEEFDISIKTLKKWLRRTGF